MELAGTEITTIITIVRLTLMIWIIMYEHYGYRILYSLSYLYHPNFIWSFGRFSFGTV
jgi:hypothetical protein